METDNCQETIGTRGRFALGKDGIWVARSRRTGGMKVICRAGCLWVSWERGGDRLLQAGESLRVEGSDLVVIQGLEESRVEICETGREEARWLAALRDFAAGVGLRLRLSQHPARG